MGSGERYDDEGETWSNSGLKNEEKQEAAEGGKAGRKSIKRCKYGETVITTTETHKQQQSKIYNMYN